tara:strand:+ start:14141 stop:14830 length:690 start_codon:yes stop_codon:yes gene_type:complete
VNYETLECDGYERLPKVFIRQDLSTWEQELDTAPADSFRERKNGTRFAIRNVHLQLPRLRPLLEQGRLFTLASEALGGTAELVNATLFDKLPGANWFVPPHQDLFIPIAGSTDDPRWTNWSTKASVQYVEPPVDFQRELLAVRIHLDQCPERNGALEVVPGSHQDRLSEAAVALIEEESFELCPAGLGDVLLMRPLLVHRSRSAKLPQRRRVLHVVYSAAKLPEGLWWT